MTDSLANVVIPYARFVECQERRRRIAAELTLQNPPPTVEAAVVPVPAERAFPLDASTHLHGGGQRRQELNVMNVQPLHDRVIVHRQPSSRAESASPLSFGLRRGKTEVEAVQMVEADVEA